MFCNLAATETVIAFSSLNSLRTFMYLLMKTGGNEPRTGSVLVAGWLVLILGGPGWTQGFHLMIWSDSLLLQIRPPPTFHKGWLACVRSHSLLWAELGVTCLFPLPGAVFLYLDQPSSNLPVQSSTLLADSIGSFCSFSLSFFLKNN